MECVLRALVVFGGRRGVELLYGDGAVGIMGDGELDIGGGGVGDVNGDTTLTKEIDT